MWPRITNRSTSPAGPIWNRESDFRVPNNPHYPVLDVRDVRRGFLRRLFQVPVRQTTGSGIRRSGTGRNITAVIEIPAEWYGCESGDESGVESTVRSRIDD